MTMGNTNPVAHRCNLKFTKKIMLYPLGIIAFTSGSNDLTALDIFHKLAIHLKTI